MTVGRSGRVAARVAFATTAVGAVVVMAAGPAVAATTISVSSGGSSLSDGDALDHNAVIAVKGTSDATTSSRQLTLSVSVPGRGSYTLDTGSAAALQRGSLSASVDTACPDWSSSPCVEAVNGTYTFTFKAGSTASSSSVQLRVPPAAPTGFDATVKGTVVSFSWSPNSEPDLAGYDIVEDSGTDVTPGGVDAGSVCDASGCGVSVDFGPSAQGSTHSFQVIAERHTSPGSSSYVSSAGSASQSVTFPAPPSPSPSDSPSGSGGGSGGGSGTGGGGGASSAGGGGGSVGSRGTTSHRLSGKNPAADLRQSLPTVTAAGAPDLPTVLTEVKPLPQGTYKPTLAYPDQIKRSPLRQPTRGVASTVLHDVGRALDIAALWRGLAAAAILMLLAVHLRAFVERVDQD